ncbi:Calpain-type cysteine protease DEK1 [Capsicum chinense]|nr:Calpain-type cysteine protease DEK1 [Capsicum chinense]
MIMNYDYRTDIAAFLVLYGIALAIEGWGVVASLQIYPPFAGAAVSAITLIVAFGFAVSRPCLTLEMVEDAIIFLSKETMVQAIALSATKTRNALSGTYSAPQRSASSAALLVGDPTMMRDRGGNFVLPRADVMKLRDRLRNEELAAGSIFSRLRNRTLRHEATSDVGHRREMCAHARILALEEAIDTEWAYMWDKFGGYLLLLLGLTAKAERVQPESGPVCLFGTEFQKNIFWEFLVADSEQGIEAGQVGLRLITKTDKQTTVKEWSISATSIADGSWHIITQTIDAELGEATCYLDGNFDGYQTGLPLRVASCIWELGTDVWVSIRPPIDVDSFGRSDSEGAEAKVHITDVFLWGRCLTEDEIASLPAAMGSAEYSMIDLPDDNWQWADSPTRVDGWDSDPADVDLYERDDVDWDGQYSSGRKRRSDRDGVVLDVDSFTRTLRKPRVDTQKEINQHMLSVEIAVKEALLARGESHFTDQEFPPNDRSLFMDPDNPPSKLQVVSEWMRPTDIVKEKHLGNHLCLFSGVSNSSDVCQGRLGDCWFLSAVAVLTEVSRISKVIITPEYNHEGIYTVRFCIQGDWVAIVVNDWIPCESPGKPAFATSRKGNEKMYLRMNSC